MNTIVLTNALIIDGNGGPNARHNYDLVAPLGRVIYIEIHIEIQLGFQTLPQPDAGHSQEPFEPVSPTVSVPGMSGRVRSAPTCRPRLTGRRADPPRRSGSRSA